MTWIRRRYFSALLFAGVAILPVSALLTLRAGLRLADLLFFVLAGPAGWLRIRLEPSADLNLTPIVLFLALLSASPITPFVVATLSALVSSRFFARNSWVRTFEEVAEEAIPALVMMFIFIQIEAFRTPANRGGELLAYALAVIGYIAVRLVLAVLRSNFGEGVSGASFRVGPGRYILANLLFFALASLGLSYLASLYSQVRFLTLALATVALVEFYHPWKLLTEQSNILFSNLAMIAQAIDIKDPYTARHSRNVSQIAVRIARAMRLPESEVTKIRIGALLHDIGKIGVSGRIIRKPSALSSEEASKMRGHSVMSADIMQPIELLADSAEMVRYHHEHYDGSGYPDGIKGEKIPIGSRIILVADAFDAMTTDRPYRRGRSRAEALSVLKEHSGKQFDPIVVKTLESVIEPV